MFIESCLYACVLVSLVTANVQYHQVTCPYSHLNYANSGSAPIIVQPSSSYTQQYVIQNVPNYQPRNSITDIQQMYLSQILSNPAIQAFIDPSTKIYNQNGVDISDQILPRTPNVVNNYFIVPTEYVNDNVKKKIRTKSHNKSYVTSNPDISELKPKSVIESTNSYKHKSNIVENERYINNKHTLHTGNIHRKNKNKNSSSNTEQNVNFINSEISTNRKNENLMNKNVVFDDQMSFDKAKTNIKRQDTTKETSTSTVHETITNYKTNHLEQSMTPGKFKHEVSEVVRKDNKPKCTSADSNHNNEQNTQPPKNQDNFMKQWMAYIKSFTPQNFESYDFSNFNLPYNFDQIYQFPKASSPDTNAVPKTRRRKQRKNKQIEAENSSDRNIKNEAKKTTIEIVPKNIVKSDSILTEIIQENVESNLDTPITKSLEATHYLFDVSTENTQPVIYNIIDYYPDFTKDEVNASDEDEPYFYHNTHYYEPKVKDPVIIEGSRHENKRESTKQLDKSKRGNDIHTLDTDFKDHRKPVFEDLKFQTPPTLTDPGFETKKVNVRDITNEESKINDDRHNSSPKRNVETVFARSRVAKYGQHDEVIEKPKVIEEAHRNDTARKNNPKDGDTTVVFAQSWK